MKKKILSILLVLSMVGVCVAGCANTETTSKDVNPVIENEVESESETDVTDEGTSAISGEEVNIEDEIADTEELADGTMDAVEETEDVIDESILTFPLEDVETVKETLYAIKDPALAMEYYMYISQQINDGLVTDETVASEMFEMIMDYIDYLSENDPDFLSAMNDALFASAETKENETE